MASEKNNAPSSTLSNWLILFVLMPGLAGLSYLLALVSRGGPVPLSTAAVVSPAPAATAVSSFPLTGTAVVSPAPVTGDAPFPFPSGSRRSEPYPAGSVAELAYWQVQVTDDILRGDAAWQWLAEANSFNDPPPEGWEYLLVKLRISNRHTGADPVSLGMHVTGDSNVVHFGFDAGVTPPSPSLETYLSPGGESEGWDAFRIRTGESSLMLVLQDFDNYEEDEFYLALEPNVALTVPTDVLNAIPPSALGESFLEPARLNQTVTTADWQATLTELIRGPRAWEWLQEVNSFNDPAPEGMEYLLIYAQVRYIGTDPGPVSITRRDFWLLQEGEEEEYEYPSVVHPDPELYADLFPNGETEGWMVMQVRTDHAAPILGFNPSPYGEDAAANRRYFVLAAGE